MVKFLVSFLVSFSEEKFRSPSGTRVAREEKPLDFIQLTDNFEICYITPEHGKKQVKTIIYKLPCQKSMETKVTVICWKHMAKVYLKKEFQAFETVHFNSRCWVAFTIVHRMASQEQSHLEAIHSSTIEFKFIEDQNPLVTKGSGDKDNEYYGFRPEELIENIKFRPLFQVNKVDSSPRLIKKKKKHGNVSIDSTSYVVVDSTAYPFAEWKIPFSFLKFKKKSFTREHIKQYLDQTHLMRIIKAMTSLPVPQRQPRKSSGIKKSRERTVSNEIISFEVEKLYFEKSVWTIQSRTKNSAHTVYLSVFSWMTENTCQILNPIGIQIHKFIKLPENIMMNKRIKFVQIEYELEPVIPRTRSPAIEITELFNPDCLKWIKTFLTRNFSPVDLISLLQSKKLLIMVLGKCKDEVETRESHIFGTHFDDYNISKFTKTKIPESTNIENRFKDLLLLATAAIDLSPLVFGSCCVIEWATLTSKCIKPKMYKSHGNFLANFNTLTIHSDKNSTWQGVLPDCSLIDSSIKCSAKISHLVRIRSLVLSEIGSTYHRALAFIFDSQTAASVLNAIWEYNKQSLGMEEFAIPLVPFRSSKVHRGRFTNLPYEKNKKLTITSVDQGPRPSHTSLNESNSSEARNYIELSGSSADLAQILNERWDNYVTGFFIDCIEYSIVMFEALAAHTFPKVHQQLMKISVDKGRVMYSSELLYKERLYKVFKHFGGVYCITMRKTPSEILNNKATYVEGCMPVPAYELLCSIRKLQRSKSLLPVIQNNLLPTPNELISFDIEFGLPLCANVVQ